MTRETMIMRMNTTKKKMEKELQSEMNLEDQGVDTGIEDEDMREVHQSLHPLQLKLNRTRSRGETNHCQTFIIPCILLLKFKEWQS